MGTLTEVPGPLARTVSPRHLPSSLRNVLSNWAGFACSATISFFLSPFVVHHLGNSAYGAWILIGSLTGYLGLLNLGVRGSVTRYVARFHAESNHQEVNAVASSALAIFLAAGTLAIVISLALAALLVHVFHIPEDLQSAARTVVILSGLNIAISLVSGVFGGVVAALHRFDLINLVEVGNSSFAALATVLVLQAGKGLIGMAVVSLVFAIVAGLVWAGAAFRVCPALKIDFRLCDRDHLKLIFGFSIYVFLLQISGNLIFYSDSVVIGAFLSVGAVAFFAIAGNLMNYSRALISGITTTMTPRASALQAMGGMDEVNKLLVKACRFGTIIMLPIAVTFLLRGSSFIGLWLGDEYADQSGKVLRILALALIFVVGGQVAISIMMGIGKHKPVVLVACFEALCNLGLSIALVRRMGIFGVAWGTTIPSLLTSLLFWPWYIRSVAGIPVRTYITSTWCRPALSVMPFALLTYCIEKLWPASNLLTFFLQTAAIVPTVALASWHLCLDGSQRGTYSRQFVYPVMRILGRT